MHGSFCSFVWMVHGTATLCLSGTCLLLCVRKLLVVVVLLKNVGKLCFLFICYFITIFGLDVY